MLYINKILSDKEKKYFYDDKYVKIVSLNKNSTTATWNGTAAITDILLRIGGAGSQTFPNGTLITLFGIKAA